jgi:hypothetical protein
LTKGIRVDLASSAYPQPVKDNLLYAIQWLL